MQRILESSSFLVKPTSHISTYFSGIFRNEASHTDELFSLLVINAFEVIKLYILFFFLEISLKCILYCATLLYENVLNLINILVVTPGNNYER